MEEAQTDMKKRIVVFLLAGMLACSSLLGGCGGKSRQKAQEYKELGIKQMENAEYAKAEESFQKALDQSLGKVSDQEIDVCYYKALAQFKNGELGKAIETYDSLIKYDKKNWEAYYLRGSVYLKNGDSTKALQDYEKAVSLNTKDCELYTGIYENLENTDQAKQGEKYLEQALKLKPSSGEDYMNLGYAYFLKKDYANAEKMLNQAVDKGTDQALLKLGKVYAAQDQKEKAEECFNQYMKAHPKDVDAITTLGDSAMSAGEYADAKTYFEKALSLGGEKKDQQIWKKYIAACEYAGEFEQALSEARAYLKQYADDETMQKEAEFLKTRVSDETDADTTSSDGTGSDAENNSGQ